MKKKCFACVYFLLKYFVFYQVSGDLNQGFDVLFPAPYTLVKNRSDNQIKKNKLTFSAGLTAEKKKKTMENFSTM